MRGVAARLCHGGERRPREPIGPLAPFLRVLAWAVASITCVAVLVLAAVYALTGRPGIAMGVGAVAGVGPIASLLLRYLAGDARHADLTLRATLPPRR
jgi:hypothetical protein